jgi:flotillin
MLQAKAKDIKKLVQACGDDAKSASTMLLIEKLEEIVKIQAEAIKNIKIDKITVWDSGANERRERVLNLELHQPVCEVAPRSPRYR